MKWKVIVEDISSLSLVSILTYSHVCTQTDMTHTTHILHITHIRKKGEGGKKTVSRGKLQGTLSTQAHEEKCFLTSNHFEPQKPL